MGQTCLPNVVLEKPFLSLFHLISKPDFFSFKCRFLGLWNLEYQNIQTVGHFTVLTKENI